MPRSAISVWKLWDWLAVFSPFAGVLGFRPVRTRRLGDGAWAGGGRGLLVLVVKEHRRQLLAHMPFDVIGQHA